MKLTDKGDIRPPPILTGPAQRVSGEIQSWPKIVAATHWYLHDRTQVDGADFYVGERELGHIHLDGEIHLGTTKALRDVLIEQRLAEPFEWHEAWVQFSIRSNQTAPCPVRRRRAAAHAGSLDGPVRPLARAGALSQMPASISIFRAYQYGRGIVARICSPCVVREHSLAPIRCIPGIGASTSIGFATQ
jgi:hypothetical protein